MSDKEEDARIVPFTVKDALYLHEKQIHENKDSTNDLRRAVTSFEDKFKTLMERINEGVSPTMRRIETKQTEIEKQIIQVEANLTVKITEIKSEVKVLDNHFSDRFAEYDRVMSGLRGLLWKIIGAALIGGFTVFISTWVYLQQIKTRINALPTVIETGKRK